MFEPVKTVKQVTILDLSQKMDDVASALYTLKETKRANQVVCLANALFNDVNVMLSPPAP